MLRYWPFSKTPSKPFTFVFKCAPAFVCKKKMLLMLPLRVKKPNANFYHRTASSPAELCVFCVAFALLWAFGWKVWKQNSLGKEVTFILHPRLPQAQLNSRMLGRESRWVDTLPFLWLNRTNLWSCRLCFQILDLIMILCRVSHCYHSLDHN